MAAASKSEIWVVPSPDRPTQGAKGLLGGGPVKLDTNTLRENIGEFVDCINLILAGVPKLTEPYKLEEVELKIEINAEGSFQLVGGVKAGATGGITLRLKR
jgi:hypothetical protein